MLLTFPYIGQDVGRSCILVTVGGKNIMFDCGKIRRVQEKTVAYRDSHLEQ